MSAVTGSSSDVPVEAPRSIPRRIGHALGSFLVLAGVVMLAWAGLIYFWQDPVTAVYAKYEQHRLASSYRALASDYKPVVLPQAPHAERQGLAVEARRYRLDATQGQAIGRIMVPRLGLSMVMVNGTDESTLKRGPGRDLRTFMPGEGQLVYVAGHRTTYLAPFSHIDSLRPGDLVTLRVPYGDFIYRVRFHRIVVASDLAVLQSHGKEVVVLQACHPRFFASHRYLVYAYPVRVIPRNGRPYDLPNAQ
ncbi:MAG: sortase [Gaiellaceae bacterium]|nr:sortase [Gaiellaceae bacterium]